MRKAVPQASWAMAIPVTFVLVSVAGHSRVIFGGTVMAGGVVSRTVIRCTQVLWLLQLSLAVQVRSMRLMVRPRRGGALVWMGGGPKGGCGCGVGNGLILFALIEIVLLPMEMSCGGLSTFAAETSWAAMPPPIWAGAVALKTIQISTTTWSPTSRPVTRKVP